MDTTSDHVAQNREQLERLRRLVARLSDDDLRRELPDGWTICDALAHLAFYDRRAAVLLERFGREGVFASPYDYETINAALPLSDAQDSATGDRRRSSGGGGGGGPGRGRHTGDTGREIRRLNQVKLERADHRRNHLDDIEALLESR